MAGGHQRPIVPDASADTSPPRRVVVTGGAGFIGANLCMALRSRWDGVEILVVDDLSTGKAENLYGISGVELIEDTVLNGDILDTVVRGADVVVHLAARPSVPRSLDDPVASHEANATGTLSVLEAARRGGGVRVVVASSSSVYGGNRTLPVREDVAPAPMSPYAASKLAAEAYTLAYSRCFDLPVLVFRFFNVFGPLQAAGHAYAAVVPIFVTAALAGEPLPVHGDGRQTRDFTFVDSVTRILVDAIDREVVAPGPVNLAFGTRHSLLELVAALEKVLGRPVSLHHEEARRGDVRDSQADDTRLRELFPDVEPVALEQGLATTVQWLASIAATQSPQR